MHPIRCAICIREFHQTPYTARRPLTQEEHTAMLQCQPLAITIVHGVAVCFDHLPPAFLSGEDEYAERTF